VKEHPEKGVYVKDLSVHKVQVDRLNWGWGGGVLKEGRFI